MSDPKDPKDLDKKRTANIALPSTVSALIEQRKTKTRQTLNDQVESVHMQLWANESYRKLLDAVYPEMAVEGSLVADDFEAARMIRNEASEIGSAYVASQKLDTLRKALGVVLRRYSISRKERRE